MWGDKVQLTHLKIEAQRLINACRYPPKITSEIESLIEEVKSYQQIFYDDDDTWEALLDGKFNLFKLLSSSPTSGASGKTSSPAEKKSELSLVGRNESTEPEKQQPLANHSIKQESSASTVVTSSEPETITNGDQEIQHSKISDDVIVGDKMDNGPTCMFKADNDDGGAAAAMNKPNQHDFYIETQVFVNNKKIFLACKKEDIQKYTAISLNDDVTNNDSSANDGPHQVKFNIQQVIQPPQTAISGGGQATPTAKSAGGNADNNGWNNDLVNRNDDDKVPAVRSENGQEGVVRVTNAEDRVVKDDEPRDNGPADEGDVQEEKVPMISNTPTSWTKHLAEESNNGQAIAAGDTWADGQQQVGWGNSAAPSTVLYDDAEPETATADESDVESNDWISPLADTLMASSYSTFGQTDNGPTPATAAKKQKTSVKAHQPTADEKEQAEKLKLEGNNLMQAERFEEAIEKYTKAIELDNSNQMFYSNCATYNSKLERYYATVEDCQHALDMDPKYGKAYGHMGLVYSSTHKHKEADDCFKKAIETRPEEDNDVTVTSDRLGIG